MSAPDDHLAKARDATEFARYAQTGGGVRFSIAAVAGRVLGGIARQTIDNRRAGGQSPDVGVANGQRHPVVPFGPSGEVVAGLDPSYWVSVSS